MERFEIIDVLGSGAYANVYLATDRNTNQAVALKQIPLDEDEMISHEVIREASLLYELHHQNIVKLESVFPYEGGICLVLECLSMDLSVHMHWYVHKYPGPIKGFLKQILRGVSYCHSHGILHRDLKPENMLIDTSTGTLKLADFGSARGFITPEAILSPEVVTLCYRAPENLLNIGSYSTPVDMWSVGCIFAEMVNKNTLFVGESEIDVLCKIFSDMGAPDEEIWPGVTSLIESLPGFPDWRPKDVATLVPGLEPAGVDLLSKLLCLDPRGRITAQDALEHEYLKDVVCP